MENKTPFPRRWQEDALFYCLATVLLVLTYNTVLRYQYGMWDDYTLLKAARHELHIQFELLAANGRPLQAWLSWLLFRWADDVAGLVVIRAVSLAGLIALCGLLYRGLRTQGWWSLEAGALALGICTLPAFGVHLGWATMFHGILGAVAAWIAGVAVCHSENPGPWRLAGGVGALLVALMFYQPSASLYWLAVAVALFPPGDVVATVLRRALKAGMVFGATLFGYFLLIKLCQWLWFTDPVYAGTQVRGQLTGDPLAKLDWFVREPLLLAASLGDLGIQELVAGAVLSLTVAGIVIHVLRSGHWQALPVWLLLLPAAYMSNLLVAENATFYRVLAPLSAMVFFLFVWGTHRLMGAETLRPRAVLAAGLALLVLSSAYSTYRDVREHIARLHAREWQTVLETIAEFYGPRDQVLAFTRPAFRHALPDQLPGLEYAMLTTALPMGEIYQLAFASLYGPMAAPFVVICKALDDGRNCPELSEQQLRPVVDLASRLEHLRS